MIAGLLKERIDIYRSVITKSRSGEETVTWEKIYSTRARLIHNNGNRTVSNEEIYYDYQKTFEMRYLVFKTGNIKDFDRIRWQGMDFQILDIEPLESEQKITVRVQKINE